MQLRSLYRTEKRLGMRIDRCRRWRRRGLRRGIYYRINGLRRCCIKRSRDFLIKRYGLVPYML